VEHVELRKRSQVPRRAAGVVSAQAAVREDILPIAALVPAAVIGTLSSDQTAVSTACCSSGNEFGASYTPPVMSDTSSVKFR
jgi:hypothetical protein